MPARPTKMILEFSAPKARNVKAWGKAQGERSAHQALKARNTPQTTLFELFRSFRAEPYFDISLGRCPRLSYFAPLALTV